MTKLNEQTKNRIKKILFADKLACPSALRQTLKIEIYGVLKNFLEVQYNNLNVNLNLLQSGDYQINITASASKIKSISKIIQ